MSVLSFAIGFFVGVITVTVWILVLAACRAASIADEWAGRDE